MRVLSVGQCSLPRVRSLGNRAAFIVSFQNSDDGILQTRSNQSTHTDPTLSAYLELGFRYEAFGTKYPR